MLFHSYPYRDNAGNTSYQFTAEFGLDDIQNIMLLRENENYREEIVRLLSPAAGIAYTIRGYCGTFPEDIFKRLINLEDRKQFYLHDHNEYQISGLVRRGNMYAGWFKDQFFRGGINRDCTHMQTFSYAANPTGKRDRVIVEVPYTPPVLNDWKPQVPQAPVYEQQLASPILPKPYKPEV